MTSPVEAVGLIASSQGVTGLQSSTSTDSRRGITANELDEELVKAFETRKSIAKQITAADKVKARLGNKLRKTDLHIHRLQLEKAGQKSLF